LRWADAVVCMVTSAYLASPWCAAEVGVARSQGSRLLPLLAERGVEYPLLEWSQYADLASDPDAARVALAAALRRVDAAGGWGWLDGRSPFPGLRPFDVEEHRVFFGRAAEVRALAELMRSPAERAGREVLLVVGPSGCGKSSLVRAGLLPVMAAEPNWWALAPLVPGADPVGALTRELAAGVWSRYWRGGESARLLWGAGRVSVSDGWGAGLWAVAVDEQVWAQDELDLSRVSAPRGRPPAPARGASVPVPRWPRRVGAAATPS
jgi:hypothetical protein